MGDSEKSSPSTPELLSYTPEEEPLELAKKAGKKNLLQWMEITVSEPEKRTVTSMKVQDTFYVYLIETRITDNSLACKGDGTTSLWRRYNEFELLRNYLECIYPALVIPPLPEKKPSYLWQGAPTDKFDPEFVERRRAALEIFLLRLASHPIISQDRIFISFLQQDEGWKETVYSTDFQSKSESRLKALSAAYRLKKPENKPFLTHLKELHKVSILENYAKVIELLNDNFKAHFFVRRFEELKNYSNELENNIANLLKIRARMADKVYGIHKVHCNYGRVFCEWSGIEKEMAEPLNGAGHYMNVYGQTVDAILEEEEQYADQLKEYMAFGDSLRTVCRKYECTQYDFERAEDNLAYKQNQKEQLIQGKTASSFSLTGMKSKIFGSDTPEQRDQKIKQLEEQIQQSEVELRKVGEETQKFIDTALRDIDRFKRQKVKDLREIFTNYAIMQIKQCKKGIAVWTSAKDCLTKM